MPNLYTLESEFNILPDMTAIDGFAMSTGIRYTTEFSRTAVILSGNLLPYRLEGNWLPRVYAAPGTPQEILAPRQTGYTRHRIQPGSAVWSVLLLITSAPVVTATNVQVLVKESCKGGRQFSQVFQFGTGYLPSTVYRETLLDPPFIVGLEGLMDVEVTNQSSANIQYQLQLKALEPLAFEPVVGGR